MLVGMIKLFLATGGGFLPHVSVRYGERISWMEVRVGSRGINFFYSSRLTKGELLLSCKVIGTCDVFVGGETIGSVL